MHGSYGKFLSAVLLSLWLIVETGCTDWGQHPLEPWLRPAAYPPDLPTPERRVQSLRSLARRAAGSGVERQQEFSAELSKAIWEEEDLVVLAQKIRVLGEHPSAAADAELEAALRHGDPEVRMAACEAWAKRRDAKAASLLAEVLDGDLDMDVRLTAARALGQVVHDSIVQETAVAALGRALDDRDPALRYQAVLSLETATGENLGRNVQLWQQYVRGELLRSPKPVSPDPVSVAEQLRQTF